MGQAKLRGTREQRVAQAVAKRAEQQRWAPAVLAARRDPRWRKALKHERRSILVEHALSLGIIAPAQEKSDAQA